MITEPSARKIWDQLLKYGGYSIGYFSVTVDEDCARVFHYRTKEICRCPREKSYDAMEIVCNKRGYSLPDLLTHFYPKSFRSLTLEETG